MKFLNNLIETSIYKGENFLDKASCEKLLKDVLTTREFNENLFLPESEFRKNPLYKGVNPIPGRNLLEKFDVSFLESKPEFIELMSKVLGPNYSIVNKKFVMGVPESIMPEWLLKETQDMLVSNLGPYVKPEYRDITYFHGIDFHQDIIDFPTQKSDFITFYVYLDNTDENTSPLYLVPRSHKLGATTFPHSITYPEKWKMLYDDRRGNSEVFDYEMLTGPTGSVYFWHACTLHGTKPHLHSKPRISLRYIIRQDPESIDCLLAEINKHVKGPLSLEQTRKDLDMKGSAVQRGNIINKQ